MKVFISFATEDVTVAGTLYKEMDAAGAVVFQFGRSETAGKPSWEEILAWIRQCDVFILLVSKNSVKSRAVKEELICAHYSHINTDEKNPSKLIPAIIEHGVDPPPLIQHFTRFDLTAIKTALPRLLKQLGLDKKAFAAPAHSLDYASLPDPSEIFQNYLRKNPKPTVANLWSEKAEKIVSNYHLLKPKEITPSLESSHLKNILRAQIGKGSRSSDVNPFAQYDGLFLGLSPDSAAVEETPRTTDKLSELLLTYDPKKPLLSSPLPVPKVTSTIAGLAWQPVTGASAYAVEESTKKDFASPNEVYRGTDTSYGIPLWGEATYYRVKAVGGVFRPDSGWSDVIRKKPTIEFATLTSDNPYSLSATKLAAPTLALKSFGFGPTLEWTTVENASGYLLERSDSAFALGSEVIYDGDRTTYVDFERLSAKSSPLRTEPEDPILQELWATKKQKPNPLIASYDPADTSIEWPAVQYGVSQRRIAWYRVKAKAGVGKLDSDWSNVVTDASGGLLSRNKKK